MSYQSRVKKLQANATDCGHAELEKLAIKSGFLLYQGKKHTKVKTRAGSFVAMIPRHEPISKHTVKGIVESMNGHGAEIDLG